jgi:hypothetical protein
MAKNFDSELFSSGHKPEEIFVLESLKSDEEILKQIGMLHTWLSVRARSNPRVQQRIKILMRFVKEDVLDILEEEGVRLGQN